MMRIRNSSKRRFGKVIVLFTLLLPLLFGMLGLVNDLGLIATSHRQTQNGADSAAMAAAMEKLQSGSESQAEDVANEIMRQFSELKDASLAVHFPPTTGPYAGNPDYVEAVVTDKVPTWFVHVLNNVQEVAVTARAVAGIKSNPKPNTIFALNSFFAPGLALVGGTVEVEGKIAVNSNGSGKNEKGVFKLKKNPLFGVLTGISHLRTSRIRVVGGVDFVHHFENTDPAKGNPLKAFRHPVSDPYLYLPTPTTANGVVSQFPSVNGKLHGTPQNVVAVIIGGSEITFSPGIYSSISITGIGPGKVVFEPGIYVLLGNKSPALNIATTVNVLGDGVMFYNAGSNFDVFNGLPDRHDGNHFNDGVELGVTIGAMTIAAPNMKITPLDDVTSPFHGMFIYQRRRNPMPVTLASKKLTGTIYARWAPITVVGPGTHQAQIAGGSLLLSRPPLLGSLVFENTPDVWAKGRQVFLVE